MKRSPSSREGVAQISKKGEIRIRSAEGRGVGTSLRGARDARSLARESAQRATRTAQRG
jgi:hypothetical protein